MIVLKPSLLINHPHPLDTYALQIVVVTGVIYGHRVGGDQLCYLQKSITVY